MCLGRVAHPVERPGFCLTWSLLRDALLRLMLQAVLLSMSGVRALLVRKVEQRCVGRQWEEACAELACCEVAGPARYVACACANYQMHVGAAAVCGCRLTCKHNLLRH